VLRVEVTMGKRVEGGGIDFKGEGVVIEPDAAPGEEPATAVSGRFVLRPARVGGV
jgi:hypothetical protein